MEAKPSAHCTFLLAVLVLLEEKKSHIPILQEEESERDRNQSRRRRERDRNQRRRRRRERERDKIRRRNKETAIEPWF